jgi:hypothetical protein
MKICLCIEGVILATKYKNVAKMLPKSGFGEKGKLLNRCSATI